VKPGADREIRGRVHVVAEYAGGLAELRLEPDRGSVARGLFDVGTDGSRPRIGFGIRRTADIVRASCCCFAAPTRRRIYKQ